MSASTKSSCRRSIPTQVIDAFRDVQAARADNKERLQNEAGSYANKIVPEARGEAERILQAARAYKEQTVAEATGQTRFLQIYEEYKKAPEVTRKRMYLETMERVLGGTATKSFSTARVTKACCRSCPLIRCGPSPCEHTSEAIFRLLLQNGPLVALGVRDDASIANFFAFIGA
jgi:hypothetical protein